MQGYNNKNCLILLQQSTFVILYVFKLLLLNRPVTFNTDTYMADTVVIYFSSAADDCKIILWVDLRQALFPVCITTLLECS